MRDLLAFIRSLQLSEPHEQVAGHASWITGEICTANAVVLSAWPAPGGAALVAALIGCPRQPGQHPPLDTTDFDPLDKYPYRGWESLYRDQFKWDKVVRSTHSANCTGSCSWMVYVKDGVMVREEQAVRLSAHQQGLARLQPARLPEGRVLRRIRLRRPAAQVSTDAQGTARRQARGARQRPVGARLVGRGARLHRDETARQHLSTRPRRELVLLRDSGDESGQLRGRGAASVITSAACF